MQGPCTPAGHVRLNRITTNRDDSVRTTSSDFIIRPYPSCHLLAHLHCLTMMQYHRPLALPWDYSSHAHSHSLAVASSPVSPYAHALAPYAHCAEYNPHYTTPDCLGLVPAHMPVYESCLTYPHHHHHRPHLYPSSLLLHRRHVPRAPASIYAVSPTKHSSYSSARRLFSRDKRTLAVFTGTHGTISSRASSTSSLQCLCGVSLQSWHLSNI